MPTQIDGGLTFTEPTAMLAGIVEGKENVSVPKRRDAWLGRAA